MLYLNYFFLKKDVRGYCLFVARREVSCTLIKCKQRNCLKGFCTARMFEGHTQGISCVQFDDTRIVSSSSDRTYTYIDCGPICGILSFLEKAVHQKILSAVM